MSTTEAPPERCVIVVDDALPPGLAANAAAVLAMTVGARRPSLLGADVTDAGGGEHPGLVTTGVPVLAADTDRLGTLRGAAVDAGLLVVDLPTAGQRTTDYDEYRAIVAALPADEVVYLAVALCGAAKPVRKLTGGLPLLR